MGSVYHPQMALLREDSDNDNNNDSSYFAALLCALIIKQCMLCHCRTKLEPKKFL